MKTASAPVKADTDTIKDSLKKVNFNEAMVGQFQKVADTLKQGVSTAEGRLGGLKKPQQELSRKALELEAAYAPFKKCEDNEDAPAAVRLVIADFKSRQDEIDEQSKVGSSLKAAVKSVPDKVEEFLKAMAEKASAVSVLKSSLAPQTLRTQLSKTLPDLALALRLRRLFEPVAKSLSDALDPKFPDLKGVITEKPDFKASLAVADARLKNALAKVPGWAEQAATAAQEEQAATQVARSRASRDPTHNANEVLALATEAERARSEFNSLAEALQTLLNETQRDDIPDALLPEGFIPAGANDVSGFTTAVQKTVALLAAAVQELRGGLAVDKSTWTMASVDLFYFDNVERLMRVLSPNVRLVSNLSGQDFQVAAKNARTKLNETSQDFENAEAAVSDRRQEVADLQERVRLARAKTGAATQVQRGEVAGLRRDAAAAEARERALVERRKDLDAQKALAQRRVDRATATAGKKPDDVALQQSVDLAQRDLDRATLSADEAKADEDKAHDDAVAARAAANGKTTDVDDEVTDLKAELTNAQSALTQAETNRREATTKQQTALRETFLAAQVENFAFAQARDNAPFLTNLPEPPRAVAAPAASPTPAPLPDTDPISRVLLFAFPDSRTIFIRGERDDIDLVRQIIKEFDRPEGQAVMTLRTMEVNSDGSKDSSRRALRFLKTVDDKLTASQSNVEHALTTLRDKINAQVQIAVKAQKDKWDAELPTLKDQSTKLEGSIPDLEDNIRRLDNAVQTTTTDVGRSTLQDRLFQQRSALVQAKRKLEQTKLRVELIAFLKTRQEELETVAFYDPEVLKALGWRNEFLAEAVSTRFLNAVIPPPSKTVNLAQALIVLSLATDKNREAVIKALEQETRLGPVVTVESAGKPIPAPAAFASLIRFVGDDGRGADIIGFQSKLVDALRFNAIPHVLELAEAQVRLRTQLLDEKASELPELAELEAKSEPLLRESQSLADNRAKLEGILSNPAGMSQPEVDALRQRLNSVIERQKVVSDDIQKAIDRREEIRIKNPEAFDHLFEFSGTLNSIDNELAVILGWLLGNTEGGTTGSLEARLLRERIEQAIKDNGDTSALLMQAVGLRRSARFRFSQASESAVNLTFRKYLEQVNRDLTETYVKPTFRDINDLLLREKLGVGVMQETSILASNRLNARVDPRGSAQLAVGQEQDVLEAARQLTNLFGIAGKGLATGVTGNPLALAGGPVGAASSTIQSAQSVLNALDQMPREAAPTVYGIATGNLFEVTPVIDPSGQALRFRFDLLSATQIREPNDTIDPQLPRIERHSVNTEVHLADQEIRLISQFEANSRLGIPKRRSGGLPILKDLPGVSAVPIIGWFVKRGGRAAETQQSFIFCQTAMYPTLSEVLDVAIQSPTFTGLESPGQ
jgi:hypothetical protein